MNSEKSSEESNNFKHMVIRTPKLRIKRKQKKSRKRFRSNENRSIYTLERKF